MSLRTIDIDVLYRMQEALSNIDDSDNRYFQYMMQLPVEYGFHYATSPVSPANQQHLMLNGEVRKATFSHRGPYLSRNLEVEQVFIVRSRDGKTITAYSASIEALLFFSGFRLDAKYNKTIL